MSAPSAFDNSHYEQACDQAIAMCDGNLRSTIRALIMANEYLETELKELQEAISSGCIPTELSEVKNLKVKNSQAKNLEAKNLEAKNLEAKNLEARNLEAKNLEARNDAA